MPATPSHAPQSMVELFLSEEREAEIFISFRSPVRRVKRGTFDLRVAMTADEASNLYYRLGRKIQAHRQSLKLHRQSLQAHERAADHVD